MDGITTSKASSALPPWAVGSVSGSMTWSISTIEPGQPCVMITGKAFSCSERTWMKWMSTPSISVLNCGNALSLASRRPKSYCSAQYFASACVAASCTPCERSATSSLVGQRVAAMRRRKSSICSSENWTWKGRIAVPASTVAPMKSFPVRRATPQPDPTPASQAGQVGKPDGYPLVAVVSARAGCSLREELPLGRRRGRIVPEDEHVDQRLRGGGGRDGEDHRQGAEEQADDRHGDQGDERGEPDRPPHHMRVDHVALELADGDEHDHREHRDVDRLGEPDGDDEEHADERPDDRDDLEQTDGAADQEPVVQADEIEAGGEGCADHGDHHELQAGVRAEPPVDLEIRASRVLTLRLGRQPDEQVDHRVALRDPVPGRGNREEDGHYGVGRLVPVRGDRMEDLAPRRQLL